MEAGRALAEAIAAETARREITQEAAAAIVGTTQQTFGKWVNRTTRPSDEACARLAHYLDPGMVEPAVDELAERRAGPTLGRASLGGLVLQVELDLAGAQPRRLVGAGDRARDESSGLATAARVDAHFERVASLADHANRDSTSTIVAVPPYISMSTRA